MSTGTTAEVSTGKTDDAATKERNKKIKELKGKAHVVRVDQLITKGVHKNPRLFMTESHVGELMQGIDQQGQLQEINVTLHEFGEDGKLSKFAVLAGFTRAEAMRRLVYQPVIAKYNKEHKPEKPLQVANLEDCAIAAKAFPEDLEKNLNKRTIRIFVNEDGDAGEIRAKSIGENVIRKDLSIWELMMSIEDLAVVDKKKGNEIARIISKNGPFVSQIRQVTRVCENLGKLAVIADPWETLTEEKKAELLTHAERMGKELQRRLQPNVATELQLGVSHARDFASRVDRGEDFDKQPKISRKFFMEALARLTGADPSKDDYPWLKKDTQGESAGLPEIHPTFLSWLKDAELRTDGYRTGKGLRKEEVAAAADGTVEATTTEGGKEVTVGDLAKQQAEGAAAPAAATTPAPDDGGAPAVVAAAAKVSTGNDAVAQANTDEANASTLTDVGGIPMADDVEIDPSTVTKGVSKAAPTETVKVQSSDVLLNTESHCGVQYAAYLQDEGQDQHSALALVQLSMLAATKTALGKSKDGNKVYQAATEFAESLEAYIENLEEIKQAYLKANKGTKMGIIPRPELPMVDGIEVSAQEILGDDDAGEMGDDTLPTAAELEAIEGE